MIRARVYLWVAEQRWLPTRWRNWAANRAYRLLFARFMVDLSLFTRAFAGVLTPMVKQMAQVVSHWTTTIREKGFIELLDAERRADGSHIEERKPPHQFRGNKP